MKYKAKQADMVWSEPEGFQLEVQTAKDGWAIARAAEQAEKDAAEVAKLQGDLFPDCEGGAK